MKKICYLLVFLFISSCGIQKSTISKTQKEFRGVWIATVANIDWPKNANDSIEKQQQDFIKILDFYKALNFNVVIVQVRTAGDAFYPSKYAPWSRFLTDKEGIAPKSNYDPLKWMIEEAHKRGLEFHAWLNPYRATTSLDTSILAKNHDFYLHSDWMLKYGKKYYYNPGLPEVKEHLISIIREVIKNYDIDGLHFDDYFYPYKIKEEQFKDKTTYQKYKLKNQSIEDWRRSNVDSLIKEIHVTLQDTKPWVQFGISPFGIWRNKSVDPKGSNTQAGQTNYDDLYADPLNWIQNGWVDYLVPQVYWHLKHPKVSHKTIANWWASNTKNTNLYIGNGTYRIRSSSSKAWNKKNELPKQLLLSRNTKEIKGNVFFSAKSLMRRNKDIVRILKKKFYKYPAIVPRLKTRKTNLTSEIKLTVISNKNSYTNIKISSIKDTYKKVLIYTGNKESLLAQYFIKNNEVIIKIANKYANDKIIIGFLDKFGNESISAKNYINNF